MTPAPRIEILVDHHDRGAFDCGVEMLNDYLRRRARQDRDRHVAAVFILVGSTAPAIAGFYTLSALSVALGQLPPEIVKKLPKYPEIPCTLIGRLAVDRRCRGQGNGEILLMDAMSRALRHSREIAAAAVVVDAKDDDARSFYERYGFLSFPERRDRLFLPMKTIATMFA